MNNVIKNKSINIILCVSIPLIELISFGIYNYSKTFKDTNPPINYLHCSWSYNYKTIDEISQKSNITALINIEKKIKDYTKDDIPFTDFNAKIINSPDSSLIGKSITITMTGAKNDEKDFEVDDDPLMKVNNQYFVFLRKNKSGTYTILGGPTGRLVYDRQAKTVTSLNLKNKFKNNKNSINNFTVENKNIDEIMNEIKNVRKSTDTK